MIIDSSNFQCRCVWLSCDEDAWSTDPETTCSVGTAAPRAAFDLCARSLTLMLQCFQQHFVLSVQYIKQRCCNYTNTISDTIHRMLMYSSVSEAADQSFNTTLIVNTLSLYEVLGSNFCII
jgi:hypothetical protein